jgi:AraC family transcriptional regulator
MNLSYNLGPGRFFGDLNRARTTSGFTLTEYSYPPRARVPRHSHKCSYISFLLCGSYKEQVGSQIVEVQRHDILFHEEAETHSDYFGAQGGRILSLELPARWLDRLRELHLLVDKSARLRGTSVKVLARTMYAHFVGADPESELMVEALAIELLAHLPKSRTPARPHQPNRWLRQVADLIHQSFREPVSLSNLASVAGVHPVHLAREFRRAFGRSVGEYVRALRIEFACRQLAETDRSLAEIALEAGYADQSHFGRAIMQATGLSPSAYRRRFQDYNDDRRMT